MATRGRKPSEGSTITVHWTLPTEVEAALGRLAKTGFYGRTKSEVVVTLLSREFERIADKDLLEKLRGLGG